MLLGICSGPKLYQAARRWGVESAAQALAVDSVKGDTGKQVVAPPYCNIGKPAAEGPNQCLSTDLLDLWLHAPVSWGILNNMSILELSSMMPSAIGAALESRSHISHLVESMGVSQTHARCRTLSSRSIMH